MINKILKVIFIIFCIAGIFYLALPNYPFPAQLPNSLQSNEPADVETPLRRAYFTDLTRAEVLAWYKAQFETKTLLGIKVPAYLLNYPPEESQTIIRDQARSTFLQEVVHPFREGMYVNGFEPKKDKDTILVNGKFWRQKIIIRYVPSNIWVREIIFIASAFMTVVIYNAFRKSLKKKDE